MVRFANKSIFVTDLDIQENISLAPYTTMKIGGRARFFVKALNENDVVEALRFAVDRGLEVFVLGGGSNVLISDNGFDGLVLRIAMQGIESYEKQDSVFLTVQAGEDWERFVEYCVSRGLAGIECLSGIPGSVGGTPVQNVGAYGQEVSQSIVSVKCLDRQTMKIVDLDNKACGFSYRKSIFNSDKFGRFIVFGVTYELKRNGEPKIEYKDLREHFAGEKPTLSEVRDAVLAIRRSKSMVIDPNDPDSRSAGSFFKNPIVPLEMYEAIRSTFPAAPSFAYDDRSVKVPAAWLIEKAGFSKGFALGNAGISSKHTLAIINRKDASSAEILALKNKIQAAVRDKFGIELRPEPVFVGF